MLQHGGGKIGGLKLVLFMIIFSDQNRTDRGRLYSLEPEALPLAAAEAAAAALPAWLYPPPAAAAAAPAY